MCDLFEPSKNVSTSTSTTGPAKRYQDAYASILKQAQGVAKTPYDTATESQVAGFTAPQFQAFNQVQQNQGVATPYINQAFNYTQQAANPVTGNVQQYMDPYLQNVVNATQQQFDTQNQRQLMDVRANAAKQGALGGSGRQVAEALTKEAQMNAQNPVIANLYSQGYGQALNAAQTDASRQLQAAGVAGNLGSQAQQANYTDINALLGIGGMQQGLQQQQYDTATANAQQKAAYPYQNLQWLSGIATGLGGASGTTSTGEQVTPGPSLGQQLIGAGTAALGFMSDERVKRDIEEVGQTYDGQPIYRYRYAGDPRTQIGLLAQEVETRHPEAVGGVGGIKTVNYKTATDDAVRWAGGRVGYDSGGVVSPYARAKSFIPEIGMTSSVSGPTPSLAQASGASPSSNGMGDLISSYKQAHSALSGLGSLGESMRTTTGPASTNGAGQSIGGFSTTVNPSGMSGWGNYLGSMFSGMGFAHGGGVGRMGYAGGGDVLDLYDDGSGVYGADFPEDDNLFSGAWQPPASVGSGVAGVVPDASPVAAQPSGGVAPVTTPEAAEQGGGLFGWSDATRQGLVQAGLGIMASRSPNLGNALGEGGLMGAKAYQDELQGIEAKKIARAKIAQSAAALQERARMAAEALKVRKDQAAAMEPYRQAQMENMRSLMDARKKRAELQSTIMQSLTGGDEDNSGAPVDLPPMVQPQSFDGTSPASGIQLVSDDGDQGVDEQADTRLAPVADETAPVAAPAPQADLIDTPFGRMTRQKAMKMGGAMLLDPQYANAGKTLVELAQAKSDPGLAKPTVNALEEKTINSAAQLARLGDIEKRFEPKWLEIPKRFEMLGAAWSAKAGEMLGGKLSPEKTQELRDYAQFRSSSVNNLNTILKELSGAAVTPQEYERIQNDQPVAGTGLFDGDDPVSFKAKLDRNTGTLKAAIARYNFMRSKGLNFDKNSMDQFMSLDDVPGTIDRRGVEIEQQLQKTMPKADKSVIQQKVRTQLKREFGI